MNDRAKRTGMTMTIMAWAIFLGVMTLGFNRWLGNEQDPNRHLSVQIAEGGSAEVVLEADRKGHYLAPGFINGQKVKFLLDTGATDVHLPGSLARRLGLERGHALKANTANGQIMVFATRLDEVRLGPIALRNVRASINPNMDGDGVLLGMSFLRYLDIIQRGDTLTLSVPGKKG